MDDSKSLAACLVLSLVVAAVAFGFLAPNAAAQSLWGIAGPIETDNAGDAFPPRVAIDGQGNAFAVWSQFDGTRTNARAARFVPGFGWESPETIETETFGTGVADVAADGSGNATAVWEQYDASLSNIWANRYVAGVGWGIAGPIEFGSAGNAYSPKVAMDAGGQAMAAFQYHDGTRWRAYAAPYAGAWGTPVAVDPGTGGGVLDLALAMDPNGNAVAVVSQCCGPANIYANSYSASGGSWSGPWLLETDNAGDATSPGVAMDAFGNAIAVWRQWDGMNRNAIANRYTAGVGWGLAQAIEGNPGDVGGTPSVAMDGAGNAIAVWQQFDGTQDNVWTNRFNGTTWGSPTLVELASGNAGSPDLAVNVAGEALAVWAQVEGGVRVDIWAARFRPATAWGAPERIETNNIGSAGFPAIAIEADGSGLAAWRHYDGVFWSTWANRFTADTVPPSLQISSPADGLLTNAPSVTVAGATEPGAGVTINGSAVAVLGDGTFSRTFSGLADGPHTWVVVATDADGNAGVETRTVTVDTTPPSLAFSSPTDGSVLNTPTFLVIGTTEPGARVVVRGLVVDVDPFGTFSFYLTLPEGGPHNVLSTATDAVGNARTVVWSVRIDTTPPYLALFSPAPGLTNNPSVTVSGISEPDATVFINGTAAPTDPNGGFSLTATLPDGQHIFDVNAFDTVLNVAYRSVMITVDTTDPIVTLTSPSDGASTNSPVVTVSGATEPDVHLVVNGLVVSVAADGSFAFELALPEGVNAIRATATDEAGNAAAAQVMVTVDTKAPSLSVSAPRDGLVTNAPSILVTGTTEPGAAVTVNGISLTVQPGGAFGYGADTTVAGVYVFVVEATDAAGNTAREIRTVTVDSVLPALSLASPADGATFDAPTVMVSGTTEPGVRLVVNGIVVAVDPIAGTFSLPFALPEGTNPITATATDPAGNVATASVTVTYVNPVPGLQQQLQALQAQLAAMDQRVRDLEADLATANDALDAANAALDTVQGQLDATNQTLRDTEDALAGANARLDALQTNLLLGLVAVVAILGGLQFALARMGRKAREAGEPRERDEGRET